MLKKTITYTDYDGIERTETFYFNLSEAELTEMQLSQEGGLDVMLQKIVDSKDVPSLVKVVRMIITKAYGEKSDDGRYFRKSADISEKFLSTAAYSNLYMELIGDADKMADFIEALLPKSVQSEVRNRRNEGKLTVTPNE